MDLQKLFEMQKVLDDHIMDEHPELKGQNNLDWKILALQVELGECANEWRGFKKWSNDQEPRIKEDCNACDGQGYEPDIFSDDVILCHVCEATGVTGRNPLLEEYVDCLHFILSIGLELNIVGIEYIQKTNLEDDIITIFTGLFEDASSIRFEEEKSIFYIDLFAEFLQLGEMLGFTWEQIEQSYFEKNKINHLRQNNGY